jgi:acetylornithine deacetylase/succinyl-diaminopimelate desuccinylase-like protein
MDLLELSRKLIAADTVSHKGTSAAVDILRPLYEAAGLRVEVQEVVRDGAYQQNLLGTYSGGDAAGLLLVTHLDTVDPGPLDSWTESGPYVLARKGDRVFGLGSADTKLDALCKLAAAQEFRGKPLRRSLQLLGTFEEEVGGKGARHFVGSPAFRARFVACSEPSELTVIRAHKGYAVVDVELELNTPAVKGPFERTVVDGKAAHSSTPHLGINAIEKALALGVGGIVSFDGGTVSNKVPARCVVIRARPSPKDSVGVSDPHDAAPALALAQELFAAWREEAASLRPERNPAFDPDRTVVSWGVAKVSGGGARLTFDCRLLPGQSPEALNAGFAKRAEALAGNANARLRLQVNRASPAMELKEPSELLTAARAACRDVGLPDAPQCKPTNTEAGIFAAAGVEAIVFGPGRSTANAHCANEHNLYSQMEKAILYYRALIQRLCA